MTEQEFKELTDRIVNEVEMMILLGREEEESTTIRLVVIKRLMTNQVYGVKVA